MSHHVAQLHNLSPPHPSFLADRFMQQCTRLHWCTWKYSPHSAKLPLLCRLPPPQMFLSFCQYHPAVSVVFALLFLLMAADRTNEAAYAFSPLGKLSNRHGILVRNSHPYYSLLVTAQQQDIPVHTPWQRNKMLSINLSTPLSLYQMRICNHFIEWSPLPILMCHILPVGHRAVGKGSSTT